MPTALIAILVFSLFMGIRIQVFRERESRCRRCGNTLRGLTEPKCPICGERI